jgi:hypothetical protein
MSDTGRFWVLYNGYQLARFVGYDQGAASVRVVLDDTGEVSVHLSLCNPPGS